VAHFDTASEKPLSENFIYHLNAILPKDIAANAIQRVGEEAHARFSAVLREYKYFILTEKDPFRVDTAYRYPLPLDLEKMNEAAASLREYSNFGSFCKLHGGNKTTICRVEASHWVREGDTLVYTLSADRFLRNMVRAVVGTLIDVGRGKVDLAGFRRIVEAGERGAAGTSAPAHGLFLTGVRYPEELFI
jgi:tRNA pseudouridine38-40 synthase